MQTSLQFLMFGTLGLAVLSFFAGVLNMGNPSKNEKRIANKLMILRVSLCTLLFVEMLIYAFFFK